MAVLTCSTTRQDIAEDESGHVLVQALEAAGAQVVARAILPDERWRIAQLLRRWCDEGRCDVVLTTGGTGLGPRDVTPEATCEVAWRMVPGIAELLRQAGLPHTPLAALSRGVAAQRGQTLIVNLPGSPAAVRQGMAVLTPLLRHACAVLQGAGHPPAERPQG